MRKPSPVTGLLVLMLLITAGNVYGNLHESSRIDGIVAGLKREAMHTRKVQVAGGPVAVCLLDAMRAVTPLLLREPTVAAPLREYVLLQSHRYSGVVCP